MRKLDWIVRNLQKITMTGREGRMVGMAQRVTRTERKTRKKEG